MKELLHYSGICAKVRAMRSQLISESDFHAIIEYRDVIELIEYLKKTRSYGPYIRQLDESLYHRGNIEKVLYQSLYDDYIRLLKFATSMQKELLELYGKRYEISLLNYCLRIVMNHYHVPFDIEYKKKLFSRYAHLDMENVVSSETIQEFIHSLKGTEYYDPLLYAMQEGEHTLFGYEMALTFHYYHSLVKQSKKNLGPEERPFFTNMIMTEIDLHNLKCIYRIKKYYDMTPAQIYRLTIPYHYHLKLDDYKKLVESISLDDMTKKLEGTYYERYICSGEGISPDVLGRSFLAGLCIRESKKNPYSGALLISYLFLKEIEIHRLTTAIECIRYNLPKSERMLYLGGVIS